MAAIPNEALVQKAMSKLDPEDKLIFEQSYARRAKSTGTAYVLWFLLGWHYAYLGQWGWQVLYWLTLGGVGVWALVDLFRIPGMVSSINKDVALRTLHDLRLTGGNTPIAVVAPAHIQAALPESNA
jgi:TM2 domain-containing membrane protein YozV